MRASRYLSRRDAIVSSDPRRRAARAAQGPEQSAGVPFIFERGVPMSAAEFQRMLKRVGAECGLPPVHADMLRHSIGFARADKGCDLREIQDFLGHCSINNTVIYTKLRPGRFERIWD